MSPFEHPSWPWAAALIVGFPLLLLLANELRHSAERRGSSLAATLGLVRNILLPAMGVAVLVSFVLGVPWTHRGARVTYTLVWTGALYVLLQLVNDVFFGAARPGSWRAGVPALLRDLMRAVLVGVGAAMIYSEIWGYELSGALTALGVGSLVLGLALQEPLGNVFSGLMLLAEQPVKSGEWVEVEGRVGRVVDLNWRSVNIETVTRETIIVPNSVIYKASFLNLSRPSPLRTLTLELSFSYDDPPLRVKSVLNELARQTPGVLAEPAPVVRTVKFGDFAVTYKVELSVSHQENVLGVSDEFLTRVWYAAQRAGLTIPYPIATEIAAEAKDFLQRPRPAAREVLAPHPRFAEALREPDADRLAVRVLCFTAGEALLRQGDEQDGLALIVEGQAVLRWFERGAGSAAHDLGVLGAGEFYGEHSVLAGAPSPMALIALTDVRAALFDLESSRWLMEKSPRLAREIGETIDRRARAARAAGGTGNSAATA